MRAIRWSDCRWLSVEVFVIGNFAFLSLDVYLAHSVNQFREASEWIPFYFSLAAPIFLVVENLRIASSRRGMNRVTGLAVGVIAILIGISGMLFHLESQFFSQQSLKSLVYTAPFVAPLAYAGLGFLLLLNRMVPEESVKWSRWLIFLGLGGFWGNFILALCDHAQNGFFHIWEWIPVISAAFVVGFLVVALKSDITRPFLDCCLVLLSLQFLVGFGGFILHALSSFQGESSSFFQNLIHGAPVFAPLLFANLALLSGFGIYDLRAKLKDNPRNPTAGLTGQNAEK